MALEPDPICSGTNACDSELTDTAFGRSPAEAEAAEATRGPLEGVWDWVAGAAEADGGWPCESKEAEIGTEGSKDVAAGVGFRSCEGGRSSWGAAGMEAGAEAGAEGRLSMPRMSLFSCLRSSPLSASKRANAVCSFLEPLEEAPAFMGPLSR